MHIFSNPRQGQTRREAGTESYGSPLGEEKIAGLPGMRQSGFFIGFGRGQARWDVPPHNCGKEETCRG
jgi:hypothetical protein